MALTRLQRNALAFMEAQSQHPTQDWARMCLGVCRRAFGAPMMRNAIPIGGTAVMAFHRAKTKHSFDGDYDAVPAGRLFVFEGGTKGAGHIVVTAGNGWCWTNDEVRTGHIDRARLEWAETRWGMHPLGIIDDVNTKVIFEAPDWVSLGMLRAAARRDRSRVKGMYPVQTNRIRRALGMRVATGRWTRFTSRRWKRLYPKSGGQPTAYSLTDFCHRHDLTYRH